MLPGAAWSRGSSVPAQHGEADEPEIPPTAEGPGSGKGRVGKPIPGCFSCTSPWKLSTRHWPGRHGAGQRGPRAPTQEASLQFHSCALARHTEWPGSGPVCGSTWNMLRRGNRTVRARKVPNSLGLLDASPAGAAPHRGGGAKDSPGESTQLGKARSGRAPSPRSSPS